MNTTESPQGQQQAAEGQPLTADISIQSGDLVLSLNREGRIIHVNQETAATFGYAVEQMLGVPIEVVCPRLLSGPVRFDIKTIMSGRDFVGGFDCARRDGTPLSLYMYATAGSAVMNGGRGKDVVAGVVCVAREVTAFWRAEEAVRASREKYRLLLDTSPDLVVLTTTNGRIVEANQAVSLLSGYSIEKLKSMSILDLVPADAKRKAELVFAGLWHRKRLKSVLEFQASGGKVVKVEFNASVSRIEGRPMVFAIGRDVSDRDKVEQQAEEIGEKYERMFDAIRDGVFLETMDGRILDVNRAACDFLGYSREELLQKSAADLVPAETRAWLPNIREVLLREGDLLVEAVNVRKDGTEVPVEVRCSRMELGGRTLVLVMARDISERKESESAIRHSEEQLRSLQDNVPLAIFRSRPDGTLSMVNAAAVRMYGYESAEEMLTKKAADLYAAPAQRNEMVDQLLDSGRLAGTEVEMKRKDGTKFWGLLDVRLVTDESGAPRFFDGTVQDITDRKRIMRELEESHRSLATLISNLPGMAYRCCNDRDWTMEFASQGVEALIGYRPEEVVGNEKVSFGDLIYPMDRSLVWDEVQTAVRNKEPFELTYRIRTRAGAIKWVWEQGRGVFDEDGSLLALEGFITDVTDRKNAEEQVRRNTEALSDSRRRYSTLFMGMPIGMYRTTPDGQILMANPAMVNMLGYDSFDELQSRNLEQEGFHPGYSRRDFKKRIEREGGIAGLESEWTRKDGSAVFVRENAKVVRADNGEVLFYEGTVEDVTEVKKSTEALRDREARLSLMIRRMPAVLWTVDTELVFTSSVGAGLAALGLEPGQVVGMSLFDYFNTRDPEFPAIAAHRRALKGKAAEFSFEWSGNSYRSRVEPLLDAKGEVAGVIGIAHDVTVQARAEKRAGALLRSVPQAVVYQTGGGIEYISPNVSDMLGYEAAEFARDRTFFRGLIHPEDRNRVAENFTEWLKHGGEGVLTQEFRVRRKDGEYLWVADHAQLACRTEDGKSSTLGVLVDITVSRESEDRLRASEQRYRELYKTMPYGAVVHQDRRVVVANDAMAEMLGFTTADTLVGRTTESLVHPDDRPLVDEQHRRLLSGAGASRSHEPLRVRLVDRKGTPLPVEVVSSLVEWGRRPAIQVIARRSGPA